MNGNSGEGLVAAVFASGEQAEAAIHDLRTLGLTDEDIGVVVPQPGRYALEDHESEEIGSGIVRGAMIGVPVGSLAGLALATVGVPGVGVLGLSGLAISLLEGGLWGAFVGTFGGLVARVLAGADEEHWCEIAVDSTDILLLAQAGEKTFEAHELLQRRGARCFLTGVHVVHDTSEAAPATG